MNFSQIKEQIAISLNSDAHPNWCEVLDDTNPGHYGVDDVEFEIATEDIWVEIKSKTFTFKAGELSFSARLLSSNERDGVDMNFSKIVSGAGTLAFENGGVKVLEFKINEKIDLFEPEPA